jgi:hypothetical protein
MLTTSEQGCAAVTISEPSFVAVRGVRKVEWWWRGSRGGRLESNSVCWVFGASGTLRGKYKERRYTLPRCNLEACIEIYRRLS